jgi:type I restriction enzyme M protein
MMMRTGAAIPSVSDTDFANILVYLPENSVIASIGERVRKAFELREAARREVESITLSF